jgi:hypothetical protein
MSGGFIAPIIIPAVMMPILFGWIFLVFYADSHPEPGNMGRIGESQLSAGAMESGVQAADAAAAVEPQAETGSTPEPAGPLPAGPPRQRDRRAAPAEPRQGADSGRR